MPPESPNETSMIDDMLGLGGMKPGQKNVDKEGDIIADGEPAPDVNDAPRRRPPKVQDPGDVEPEIEFKPLPDGEAGDQPPGEEDDSAETEESEEAQISTQERELELYRKLLKGENPWVDEEGAGMATSHIVPPVSAGATAAGGADGKQAEPDTSKAPTDKASAQLEDPYEGLEPDDPEYIRMKRLEKLLEYNITRNAMSRVGDIAAATFEQRQEAVALMNDTFDTYKWLREPGRPEAFDRSMRAMQAANPGITDGRKLLKMTAEAMAKFLNIDPKTGDPLGAGKKTKTETEVDESDKPPPPEKKSTATRGAPKKKLKGEAALIADSMLGFRKGGFF